MRLKYLYQPLIFAIVIRYILNFIATGTKCAPGNMPQRGYRLI